MKDLSSKENELRCGSWRYYPEARLVGFDRSKLEYQNPIYYVNLDRLNTSGQLLDWILQIERHGYEVSNFIRLVHLLCQEFLGQNIQGAFSPFEKHMQVDWEKRTIKVLELKTDNG